MSNTSILFGLLLILCMAGSSSAQKQGQLYITGYDKTQPYYFCDGVGQTSGQNVIFAFYNNDQSNDLVIDSVQYICDRSVFDVSGIDTVKNLDVGIFTSSIAYYTPKKEGTDTLTIKAYYGNFTSTGVITCHAVSAPPIAFFGTETEIGRAHV